MTTDPSAKSAARDSDNGGGGGGGGGGDVGIGDGGEMSGEAAQASGAVSGHRLFISIVDGGEERRETSAGIGGVGRAANRVQRQKHGRHYGGCSFSLFFFSFFFLVCGNLLLFVPHSAVKMKKRKKRWLLLRHSICFKSF